MPRLGPPNPQTRKRWLLCSVVLTLLGAWTFDAHADTTRPRAERVTPSGWSYFLANLGLSNDNLPAPSVFAPQDRIDPRSSSFADDDGRTYGAVFELAFTNERRGLQIITSNWYEMLTQDGSQENPSRDLRADVLNNILQVNQRFDLGVGWSLYAGMGAGLQTVGNLNGIKLQAWWHREGGFGGRWLGYGLQDDYGDMHGSVTMLALSPGVRLGKQLGSESGWNARGSFGYSALIVMGKTGMSIGQMDLTVRGGHPKIVDGWAGVFISGGLTNDRYLNFAPIAHGALGYEIGISLNMLHSIRVPLSPYVTIQSNGSGLADTTFTIGLLLGRGAWPWLRPPR